jgi:hypothetical protein
MAGMLPNGYNPPRALFPAPQPVQPQPALATAPLPSDAARAQAMSGALMGGAQLGQQAKPPLQPAPAPMPPPAGYAR